LLQHQPVCTNLRRARRLGQRLSELCVVEGGSTLARRRIYKQELMLLRSGGEAIPEAGIARQPVSLYLGAEDGVGCAFAKLSGAFVISERALGQSRRRCGQQQPHEHMQAAC